MSPAGEYHTHDDRNRIRRFLDLAYEPVDSDLRCRFTIEPASDMSMKAAASRVASESSNGTWAVLHVAEDELTDLGAVACDVDGSTVTVAYPVALFEPANMPQILSCIAGNILGMKAVDSIRLEDCEWPATIVEDFPGPLFGTAVASAKSTRTGDRCSRGAETDGWALDGRPRSNR